jgi:nucleoside-diphosphate-sugar epimerase
MRSAHSNAAPANESELEALLSEPDDATIASLASLDGDIVLLGAGGKMGPTLARMARRALDRADTTRSARRVVAVSRFSNSAVASQLEQEGVELVRADLSDPAQVRTLPVAPNMIWMAGQKFGSASDPVATWTHNVVASTYAAEHYAGSRIVCFSTGNVYGMSRVANGGSREEDTLRPDGEYAASCIGRELSFESIARRTGSPLLLYRLFYACDLRYGVVTDLALRIRDGIAIPLSTSHANVIWQGDANRLALRALGAAARPPVSLNVTGPIVSIRDIATRLAKRLEREPLFRDLQGEGDSEATNSQNAEALVANVDRLGQLLPASTLPLDVLLDWTAEWIRHARPVLNKPTKYEVRDGRF